MKSIIFDTGPIISLATNNLLDVISELKKVYNGEFYITPAIRSEIIERPLMSKRFKFEALQVLRQYQNGILKLYESPSVKQKTERLLYLANNSFKAMGQYIQTVHYAEMEVVAAALESGADAIVVDERTTRVLIENPTQVKERFEKKLHTNVEINKENLEALKQEISGIQVLRSFELVTIAYEKGILNNYILKIEHPQKELLEGILWGVKLSGCAVSEEEIAQVLDIEKAE